MMVLLISGQVSCADSAILLCADHNPRFSGLRPQHKTRQTSGWFGIGSDDKLGLRLTIYILLSITQHVGSSQ
jgi:hypothetical protein